MTTRTENIIAIFQQARNSEVLEGLRWYPVARQECERLAEASGYSLEIVVRVVAALSPNNRWAKNIIDAEAILKSANPDEVRVSTYNSNKRKAIAIKHGDLTALTGPKVTAFATNILGGDTITIDGHAVNLADMTIRPLTQSISVTGSRYEAYAAAYAAAAAAVGLRGYEMQAITWLAWRRLIGVT